MTERLQHAASAVPVPDGLENRILSVCRGAYAAPKPVRRVLPAVASLAACAAVLLVSLAATDTLPGFGGDQDPTPSLPVVITPSAGETDNTTKATTPTESQTATQAATEATKDKPSGDATTQGKPDYYPGKTTNRLNDDPNSFTVGGQQLRFYPGIFEEMTVEQLEAYFGRSIRPGWLPDDLKMVISAPLGIYHRDDKQNAEKPEQWEYLLRGGLVRDEPVTNDTNYIGFHNGETDRHLELRVSTAPYPRPWLGDPNRFKESLTVAGIEVKLAFYDNTPYAEKADYCYSALFTVDNVEFYLQGWNITRAELVKIVESLV